MRQGAGSGGTSPPRKKIEKYMFRTILCKIRAFSGKNHVKFGNFVNFSGKYHTNLGILLIFRERIM